MDLFNYQFEAIGTHWKIEVRIDVGEKNDLEQKILDRIEQFDSLYSRFRKDSWVTKISQKAGDYALPEDAAPLFDLYEDLYKLTNGSFTPLIGKTLEEAGYDAGYSLKSGNLTPVPKWEDAIAFENNKLIMKVPVLLDFGAAGKGYLVDLVSGIIKELGAVSFSVNAGGDIYAFGEKIQVAMEDPKNTENAIGVAYVTNQSICGSAGNRRAWGNFHHIIDPHTLSSPKNIEAVWAVADTAILADALTTCLYFVEPEKLSKYKFEYFILYPDYSFKKSDNFPAEIFIK